MTDKQREAHNKLVGDLARKLLQIDGYQFDADVLFNSVNPSAIRAVQNARVLVAFFAERLGDVTDEMAETGCAQTNQHPESVFRAMLGASALFEGDRK